MTEFHVPVEEDYARKHNEFFRDAKRLQISAAILGALMFVIIAILVAVNGWQGRTIGFTISLGIFGALCWIIIPALPKAMGSPQQYYDMYQLAPAIIAKVNPRDMVLLSLVDASTKAKANPNPNLIEPALAARTVTSIPGVPREVGARVPSMAVTGAQRSRSSELFQEVLPMPVAWGTSDEKVWKDAERAIPSNQWRRLEDLLDRWEEVQKDRHSLVVLRDERK